MYKREQPLRSIPIHGHILERLVEIKGPVVKPLEKLAPQVGVRKRNFYKWFTEQAKPTKKNFVKLVEVLNLSRYEIRLLIRSEKNPLYELRRRGLYDLFMSRPYLKNETFYKKILRLKLES